MFIDDLLEVPGAFEIIKRGGEPPMSFDVTSVWDGIPFDNWQQPLFDVLAETSVKPPDTFTWWEWRCDRVGEHLPAQWRGSKVRTGVVVSEQTAQMAVVSLVKMLGYRQLSSQYDARDLVQAALEKGAKTFLVCASFVQVEKTMVPHALFCMPIDRDGKLLHYQENMGMPSGFFIFGAMVHPGGRTLSINEKDSKESMLQVSWQLAYMMSMLNVRNIIAIGHERDAGLQRARQRRGKQPFQRWHTLRVITPAEVRRHERGERVEGEPLTAYHLVRGHYKTYLDEDGRRLFGKYSGRYWIPRGARGNKSIGEVNKNYEVVKRGAQ